VEVKDAADGVARPMDGALGRFSGVRRQLGEDLLDQVEASAARRKEQQLGTDGADGTLDRGRLVARWVVHDDGAAGLEFGHGHLTGMGRECSAVDQAVSTTLPPCRCGAGR
jgi:hypothetical protein